MGKLNFAQAAWRRENMHYPIRNQFAAVLQTVSV